MRRDPCCPERRRGSGGGSEARPIGEDPPEMLFDPRQARVDQVQAISGDSARFSPLAVSRFPCEVSVFRLEGLSV